MIRTWLNKKFIQFTDRAHQSFSRFMEGVMDETHTLDMKGPDHFLWHPDCPGLNQDLVAQVWFPETSVIDNGWPERKGEDQR